MRTNVQGDVRLYSFHDGDDYSVISVHYFGGYKGKRVVNTMASSTVVHSLSKETRLKPTVMVMPLLHLDIYMLSRSQSLPSPSAAAQGRVLTPKPSV